MIRQMLAGSPAALVFGGELLLSGLLMLIAVRMARRSRRRPAATLADADQTIQLPAVRRAS